MDKLGSIGYVVLEFYGFQVIEYSGRLRQLLNGRFFAVLTNEAMEVSFDVLSNCLDFFRTPRSPHLF